MLVSYDNKITGGFMFSPETSGLIGEYGRIDREFNAQAWLCGKTTMEEFTGGLQPDGTIKAKFSKQLRGNFNNQQITSTVELKKAADSTFSELNNKFNQYDSNEQLYNLLKTQVNDNTAIFALYGFIISADVLNTYCEPTRYIPTTYIKYIISYQNNINIEEEMIKYFMDMGANKEQSLILAEKYADNIKQQLSNFLERDYKELKKSNQSFTKKEYCKLYDSHAKELISYKINEIKKTMPNAYKKYFEQKSL